MTFTATIIVTFIPLSPQVTFPNCLMPLALIILGGTLIVELPGSYKLYILLAVQLCLDVCFFKFSKNAFVFS